MDANIDFPTETFLEGTVKIVAPKPSCNHGRPVDYSPSKTPVFYNPRMELNRDFAVLALNTHQKNVGRPLTVCEPLAACGVRSLRFAAEAENVKEIVMNDLNPKAFLLMELNAEKNKLAGKVVIENVDANLLLIRHATSRRRFDYIDVDPFGSPAPFIDSALRAARDGGLLAFTATDLAPLCGVHPRACLRKYGGKPLRTEYCHELAVRLLTGSLARAAAKLNIGIDIVFSYSTDHYIRVYTTIHYGAGKADASLQRIGSIQHCFSCLHRTINNEASIAGEDCPACGSRMYVAGPLWVGKLSTREFCTQMLHESSETSFRNCKRIWKILSAVRDEAEAPVTYHVVDKICEKLSLPSPPLKSVMEEMKMNGYQAFRTHFKSGAVKTDATSREMAEIIRQLNSHS